MILVRALRTVYSRTIDRSGFREIASRYVVFVLPLLFWGRPPEWRGLAFVIAGLMVRAWAAGHLYKDQDMARSGPYRWVRHPLYLGSCLLALGIIVVLHHWVVVAILGGLTALTYFHQIHHEEENLRKTFGKSYEQFMEEVGPLWPKWKGLKRVFSEKNPQPFSPKQYLKNREYECLLGVLVVLFLVWFSSSGIL